MTTQTHTIASDSRVRLYPEANSSDARDDAATSAPSNHDLLENGKGVTVNATAAASATTDLTGYDEEQIRLMEEVCIVVNEDDVPMGSGSKKRCHLMANIEQGLLHRAFSVFLFDFQGRLLLQQRATEKITFPNMWTNTCCSHPLSMPEESGSSLNESVEGVRRAAQRKLYHELGITADQIPLEKFEFLTRIHYKAPSDEKWGEHEIDYILFIQADVDLATNPNEVRATRYVSENELKAMFTNSTLHFTPWFQLICKSMLFGWWEKLRKGMINGDNSSGGLGLDDVRNQKEIVRMV